MGIRFICKLFQNPLIFIQIFVFFMPPSISQSRQNSNQVENCPNLSKPQLQHIFQTYIPNEIVQAQIRSKFPANGYLYGQGLVTNNYSKINQSIEGHEGKYIVNIGFLVVLGIILITIIPLLLWTKFCNKLLSYNKKWRKSQEQASQTENKVNNNRKFDKYLLKIPHILLLLLLFGLIGVSAAIIQINKDYQSKYNDFKCSLSMITDNLLNGANYQRQQVVFVGINNFQKVLNNFLTDLNEKYNFFEPILSSKNQPVRTISKYISYLTSQSKKLPTPNGKPLQLRYLKPLTQQKHTQVINSTFIQIFGTYTNPNSLVYNFSTSITNFQNQKTILSQNSDKFIQKMQKIKQRSPQIKQKINSSKNNIQNIQNKIKNILNSIQGGMLRNYKIGTEILLGFIITISIILAIIVVISLVWQNNLYWKCMKLSSFFCCALLWLIGIFIVVIAIGFTLSNPSVVYACQYLRSPNTSIFSYTLNSQQKSQVQTISNCQSKSKTPSYLYKSFFPPSSQYLFEVDSYKDSSVNFFQSSQNLFYSFNQMFNMVQKYRTAQILDITDQQMIEQIRNISKPVECFPDSWIPSLKQDPVYVPCIQFQNQTMYQANHQTCNQQNFYSRGKGCVGCMDTYLVLQKTRINFNDLIQKLKIRYNQCDYNKTDLPVRLATLWFNFYLPKKQVLTSLKQKLKQLQPMLKMIKRDINNTIYPVFKNLLEYRKNQSILLAQNSQIKNNMNCRILGISIDTSINVLCSQSVTYVYKMKQLYLALLFLIIFACIFFIMHLKINNAQRDTDNIIQQRKDSQQNQVPDNQIKSKGSQLSQRKLVQINLPKIEKDV